MIRDTIKNAQYYADIIPQLEQRILKYEKKRDEFPIDSSQYEKCQIHLQGIGYNYVSALYSSGASTSKVKSAVEQYLTTLTTSSVTYNEVIDAYSLAILFGVSQMCTALTVQKRYHDILIDTLAQYFDKGKAIITQDKPVFQEYQPFADYLSGQMSKDEFLRYIEEEWYSSCADRAWYESNKNPNDVYTGYWCWLGAALLKLKHDSVMHKVQYLPEI